MYAQVEKTKDKKSRALANSIIQKKKKPKQGFEFTDKRSEAIQMRKLHEMANGDSSAQNAIVLKNIEMRNTTTGIVQRYTEEQMENFYKKQKEERYEELKSLNKGFIMNGAFQPGPFLRGKLGLMRSRFDLSDIQGEQDHVEVALAGGTKSASLNKLVEDIGMDLFGRMLRNVGRLKQDNFIRELANESGFPYIRPFYPRTDPNRAWGAESSKIKVRINRGLPPHYNPEENSVSLMNPEQIDQTAHELQHAKDHIHGDLDLNIKEHRLASELNAFSKQDIVAKEITKAPPRMFENRTPKQMAETYHGKLYGKLYGKLSLPIFQ